MERILRGTFLDGVEYRVVPGSVWNKLKKTIYADEEKSPEGEIWVETNDIANIRKARGIFVNDAFLPLWNFNGRMLFLDGAYGSSKTTYAITRLLVKCMSQKKFNCFYGRQVYARASEFHKNIIGEIKRNGWEIYFDYSIKPNGTKQIFYKGTGEKCLGYGNIFTMFGCDDEESIKGWHDPTDIIVDEVNQISFETFGMLYTRLRTPGVRTQFWGMFNNCDVRDGHWIKDYIYGSEDGSTEKERVMITALRKSKILTHHSIYTDNLFQNPAAYYQQLVIKAGGDEQLIDAYCNGGWGIELNQQPYYKFYRENEHKDDVEYERGVRIAFIFDENVNPYFPSLIAQKVGDELRFIDEICGRSPNNTLEWVVEEFKRRYPNHVAGLDIMGDATSKKEDVKLEKGQNLFTMASSYLQKYEPETRVRDSNPNNSVRQRFINLIFKQEYGGLKIRISPRCVNLLADLKYVTEDPKKPGRKRKDLKMVDGIRGVQERGHLGDCMDYYICEQEHDIYQKFQTGGTSYAASGGKKEVRNTFDKPAKEVVVEVEEVDDYVPFKSRTRNRYS